MTDDRHSDDDGTVRDASDASSTSPTTDATPATPMTETPIDTDPEAESTATDPRATPESERSDPSTARFDRLSTESLRGLLDRVGLAALVLLALIAGWSFYSQTGTAIRTWLDPAYQPIVLAVFNLAVLLVALAGVAHQLSRIRKSETAE
jgi:hypothetical protein